ncbi:MAG: hypothetical protein JW900_08120 [Anaerolineae bacterium]|nr:hypothetical protein [Anaerolineae bacterium]
MRKRLFFIGVAIVFLALLVIACDDGSSVRTYYPTPTGTLEPYVASLVTAGHADIALERAADLATVQASLYLATVEAAESAAEGAWAIYSAQATATADAINSQANIQALSIASTAAALEWQTTATAQANYATATAQAREATSTAVAWNVQATARADERTATAVAWQGMATATAEAYRAMTTATADAVAATRQAAVLEREALELERERITQPVRAWGPWVLLVVGVVGLALLIWRAAVVLELRGRAIQRDQRGDAPVFVLPLPGGGTTLYDPDRVWGPATVIDHDGQVTAPQLAPPEYQERTTARDQAVDLKTRGLPAQRRPASSRRVTPAMLQPGLPQHQGPMIRVVPPARVRPWLEDVEGQLALTAGNEHDD